MADVSTGTVRLTLKVDGMVLEPGDLAMWDGEKWCPIPGMDIHRAVADCVDEIYETRHYVQSPLHLHNLEELARLGAEEGPGEALKQEPPSRPPVRIGEIVKVVDKDHRNHEREGPVCGYVDSQRDAIVWFEDERVRYDFHQIERTGRKMDIGDVAGLPQVPYDANLPPETPEK